MNRNSLKTPTGRRQTSWLFTKRAGVEFGATEDKSIQWQGGGLEPGTSGLQVQRPNHQATLASSKLTRNVYQPVGRVINQIFGVKELSHRSNAKKNLSITALTVQTKTLLERGFYHSLVSPSHSRPGSSGIPLNTEE